MESLSTLSFTLTLGLLVLLLTCRGISAATFTFVNRCGYTVWPGILPSAGSPALDSTGFELIAGTTRSFQAPTGWSGRFWGRTSCKFDGSGSGSCLTADCGSGQVGCNGAGAIPPATLAEVTLGKATGDQDYYDVSLVDGFNLPMMMEASNGSGQCLPTECAADLNKQCPAELRVPNGDACKSACEAFGTPESCCTGEYGSPATCRPSVQSQMFKAACPKAYSYAYDDATSTFTCMGADYTVTFCSTSSSSRGNKEPTKPTTEISSQGSVRGAGQGFMDSGSESPARIASTTIVVLPIIASLCFI